MIRLGASILSAALCACASFPGTDDPAQLERFQHGQIRLTCGFSCSWTTAKNTQKLKGLYAAERWELLADVVIQTNTEDAVRYFYLGRAAEELGHLAAAREYYELSLDLTEMSRHIECFLGLCQGIKFPKEPKERLSDVVARIEGRPVASETRQGAGAWVGRPIVEVVSPSGTRVTGDTVTVVVTARTRTGVADVSMSLNGDPVPLSSSSERTRGLEFSTTEKIALMPGQNLLHVVVKDEEGRVGYSSLKIDRVEAKPVAVARPTQAYGGRRTSAGPTYQAFYQRRVAAVVGIDAYRHWPALEGASGDGRRMAAKLRDLGFDEVIELYDEQATRAGILRLVGEELPRRTGKEDLAFIYFAGHGQTETLPNGEKRGYIIPVDGTVEGVFSTAVSMESLRDLSNRLPAKHVYYAMDSCYSGLGFTRGISATPKTQGYLAKITSRRAVQMITAGMEGEEAIERGGGGLFTTYLIRALEGEADVDQDGVVTAGEIGNYVRPGVSHASRQRQTPLYGTLEGNGEIAIALSLAR